MKTSAAKKSEWVGSVSSPAQGRKRSRSVRTSLGELIAGAFDAAGGELADVVRLLGSRPMRRMLKSRLVVG